MHIGKIIKLLRTENNMTQEELGKVLGIKKSAVQKYENGDIKNVKIDIIKKLCSHFHVVPWVFIFCEEFYIHLGETYEDSRLYTAFFESSSYMNFYTLYGTLVPSAQEKVIGYVHDLAKIPEYINPLYSEL